MNSLLKEKLISTKDASALSGYTSDYLARLCREGKISGTQVGRTWLIDRASLETFVSTQADRKAELAESLSRERGREYRSSTASQIGVTESMERSTRIAINSVMGAFAKARIPHSLPAFSGTAMVVALTAIILAGSAAAAGSGLVAKVGSRALAVALDIRALATEGFATFADSANDSQYAFSQQTIKSIETLAITARDSRIETLPNLFEETMRTTHAPVLPVQIAYENAARNQEVHREFVEANDLYTNAIEIVVNPTSLLQAGITGYVSIGAHAVHDTNVILSNYESLVQSTGEALLTFSTYSRDSAQHAPLAIGSALIAMSDAAVASYVDGVYDFVAFSELAPRTIIGALYDLGSTLGSVTEYAIVDTPRVYEDATLAFVEQTAVAGEKISEGSFALGAESHRTVTVLLRAEDHLIAGAIGSSRIGAGNLADQGQVAILGVQKGFTSLPSIWTNETLGLVGNVALSMETLEHQVLTASPLASLNVDEFFPGFFRNLTAVLARSLESAFHGILGPLAGFFGAGEEAGIAIIPGDGSFIPGPGDSESENPTTIYNGPVTIIRNEYPSVTYGGVPQSYVDERFDFLRRTLYNRIEDVADNDEVGLTTLDGASGSNMSISTSTITGSTITGSDIIGGSINGSLLDVATTTVTGTLTVNGDTNVTGGVSASGAITAPYFTAASTTATSTFPNLTATNATIANATTTNFMATLATIVDGFFTNLTATLATITNLVSTNAILTNATTTNATTTQSLVLSYVTPSRLLSVDAFGRIISSNLSSWVTGAANQITVTDTGAGGIALSLPNLITFGTSQPTTLGSNGATSTFGGGITATRIEASEYLAGPYVLATSTTATSAFSGNIAVGRNTTLGTSASDLLTVNATVASNFVPTTNNTYDLGSAGNNWRRIYVDEVVANTLSAASTSIAGTVSDTFTINSDNATNDTESMNLVFNRGIASPNALLTWNSTSDRFEFNFPVFSADGIFTNATSTNLTATNFRLGGSTFTSLLGTGLVNTGGVLSVSTSSLAIDTTYFKQGGNSFGATAILGTNDSNNLQFETNNQTRMTIDTAGNVGIGISPAVNKLSVFESVARTSFTGTSSGTTLISNTAGIGHYTALDFGNNGSGAGVAESRIASVRTVTGSFLTFGTSNLYSSGITNAAMTINPFGFVGIGTTSPSYLTHVMGAASTAANNVQTGSIFAVTDTTLNQQLLIRARGNSNGISGSTFPMQLMTFGAGAFEIYNAAAQPLVFGTNSAERMRIDSTGNVGIGTTTPTAKLDLSSDGTVTNRFIGLNDTAASGRSYGIYNRLLGTAGLFGIYDNTANAARLVIDSTGNVGIGTTSPAGKLTVWGTTAALVRVGDASDGVQFGKETGFGVIDAVDTQGFAYNDLLIRTGVTSGTGLAIKTTGNVGIGTTTPGSRLVVQGSGTGNVAIGEWGGGSAFGAISLNGSLAAGNANFYSSGTSLFVNRPTGGALDFRMDDVSQMYISTAGNVGIGTTSPSLFKLQVAGNIGPDATGTYNLGSLANRFNGLYVNAILANGATGSDSTFEFAGGNILLDNNRSLRFKDSGGTGFSAFAVTSANNVQFSTPTTSGSVQFSVANASGAIQFLTNGAERMRIDAAGNVGIGTTSPAFKLDVWGNNATQFIANRLVNNNVTVGASVAQIFGVFNGNNGLVIEQSTNATGPAAWASGTYDAFIRTAQSGSKLHLGSGGATAPQVTLSGGNLGIGTTSPTQKLTVVDVTRSAIAELGSFHVGADSTQGIRLGYDTTGHGWIQSANFGTTVTSLSLQPRGGNVGIGTTTPTRTLDVVGYTQSSLGFLPGSSSDLRLSRGASGTLLVDAFGTGSAAIRLGYSPTVYSTWQMTDTTAGNMTLSTTGGSSGHILLAPLGNVGIGTTTPGAKLDVYGNVNIGTGLAESILSFRDGNSANYVGTISHDGAAFVISNSESGGGIRMVTPNNSTSAFTLRNLANTEQALVWNGNTDVLSLMNTGGTVGIGTTTPSQLLTVAGNAYITGALYDSTNSPGTAGMFLSSTGTGTAWTATSTLSGSFFQQGGNSFGTAAILGTNDTNDLQFETNGTTRMTISSTTGALGIGTTFFGASDVLFGQTNSLFNRGNIIMQVAENTIASRNLALVSDGGAGRVNARIELSKTSADSARNGTIAFYTNSSNIENLGLFQAASGNVGIGTSSPASFKLEVAGNIGPDTDSVYSIGSPTRRYGSVYSRFLGSGTNSLDINSGANTIFTNNSVETMRITTAGNVGIGTSTPIAKLEVIAGSLSSSLAFNNSTIDGNNPVLKFYRTNGAGAFISYAIETNTTGMRFYTGAAAAKGSESLTERFTILTNGNVGIGSTSPTTNLVLAGAGVNPGAALPGSVQMLIGQTGNAGAIGFNRSSDGLVRGFVGYDSNGVLQLANGTGAGETRIAGSGAVTIHTNGINERVRIDNSGNVGIGTTSPAQILHTYSGGFPAFEASASGQTLYIAAPATVGMHSELFFGTSPSVRSSATGVARIQAVQTATTPLTGDLAFHTNAGGSLAERMRLTGAGNLGLGTSTPLRNLHVAGTGSPEFLLEATAYPAASLGRMWGMNNSGTTGNLTFRAVDAGITSGLVVMTLTPSGNVGIGTATPDDLLHILGGNASAPITMKVQNISSAGGAELLLSTSGTVTNTSVGASILAARTDVVSAGDTDLVFRNSSGTTLTERMRILANGSVGIGTASPTNTLTVSTSTPGGGITLRNASNNVARLVGYETGNDGGTLELYNGATLSTLIRSTGNSYFQGGNVGIGTTTPDSKLNVYGGQLKITNGTGNTYALRNDSITFNRTDFPSSYFNKITNSMSSTQANTTMNFELNDGTATGLRNVMTLVGNGNVGIGTSSPDRRLVITDANSSILKLNTTNSSVYYTEFINTFDSAQPFTIYNSQTGKIFGTKTSMGGDGNRVTYLSNFYHLAFATGSTDPTVSDVRMFINQSGNVGIGTTTPIRALEVYNTSTNVATFGSNAGALTLGVSSGVPFIQGNTNTAAGGTANLALQLSGNVGIGTTTPGALLTLSSADPRVRLQDTDTGGEQWDIQAGVSGLFFNRDGVSDLTLSQSGNVGIGTTTPYTRLTVAGTFANTSDLFVNDDKDANGNIVIGANTTGISGINFNDGVNSGILRYNHSDDSMQFFTNAAERLRITSAGNVGIGTTNPLSTLSVAGGVAIGAYAGTVTAPTNGLSVSGNVYIGNPSGAAVINATQFLVASTTAANLVASIFENGATAAVNNTNQLRFRNVNSGVTNAEYAGIGAITDSITGGARSTAMALYYGNQTTGFTEGLRLTGAGNVGIGTTTPGQLLTVAGNGYLTGGLGVGTVNTTAGSILTSGNISSGGAFLTTALSASSYFGQSSFNNFTPADNATRTGINAGGSVYLQLDSNNDQTDRWFGIYKDGVIGAGTELFRVQENGNVGIGTAAPQTALSFSLAQAASGITLNNASDETTNYSRGIMLITGNSISIRGQQAGSGQHVGVQLLSSSNVGDVYVSPLGNDRGLGYVQLSAGGATPNRLGINLGAGASHSASSGFQVAVTVRPAIAQTGTANYTAFQIQPTITSVGSGMNYLMQVGTSTNNNMFVIDTNGNTGIGASIPAAKLHVATDTLGDTALMVNTLTGGQARWQITAAGSPATTRFILSARDSSNNTSVSIDPTGTSYFNTGGNFGIGTTSPSQLLHVYGGTNPAIRVTGSGNASAFMDIASDGTGSVQTRYITSNNVRWTVGTDPAASNNFVFSTGSVVSSNQKVVITTAGNFGIGATSPASPLTVQSSSTSSPLATFNDGSGNALAYFGSIVDNATGRGYLVLQNPGADGNGAGVSFRSNAGAYSGVYSLDGSGNMVFRVNNNAATTKLVFDNFGTSAANDIWFRTNGANVRMTIANSGNVGVGTTSPASRFAVTQSANTSAGGIYLAETGNTDFRSMYMDTSGVLSFYGGDTAGTLNTATLAANGTWTNASDRAYKENITDLHYDMATIRALQPRSYTYKGTNQAGLGFIAQELKQVIPEVVYGTEGRMSVDYGSLSALALAGVKELDMRTLSLAAASENTEAKDLEVSANATIAGTLTVSGTGGIEALTILADSFLTTNTGTLPSEVLTGGSADLFKMASYAITSVQDIATRTELLATRIDDIETRVAALEGQSASSTVAGAVGLTASTLKNALESFGIFIENGIAQFNTLVFRQLAVAKDDAGDSSAGSVTILAGNTVTQVQNPYVLPTSKVFVTFTSPVTGAWYISHKEAGSFRVTLAESQASDVSFDYFILQTEGQLASPGAAGPSQQNQVPTPPPQPFNPVFPGQGTGTSTPPEETPVSGDTTPPSIQLHGNAAASISQGGYWSDEGASASDDVDGDLTAQIQVSGTVDTATPGLYTISYSVSDAAGNQAHVSRIVTVQGPVAAPTPAPAPTPGPAPEPAPEPVPAPEPAPAP